MIYFLQGLFGEITPLSQMPENVDRAWVLILNPMNDRCEVRHMVAASDRCDELLEFEAALRCEPYSDGKWRRSYKSGSELEWYNPPVGIDAMGAGIFEVRRTGWQTHNSVPLNNLST